MYVTFVEGFSFTYKSTSNLFWPTVRIEHGIIALAQFGSCALPTLKLISVIKCSDSHTYILDLFVIQAGWESSD